MNLTNKKMILIYALSPFLTGVSFWVLGIFFSPDNPPYSLIIHINIPFGYLIDYFQLISILSAVGYVFATVFFLLLVIIPSRLIVCLTIREGLISRLIKCVVILIGFSIFFYLSYEHDSFLSKLEMLFIYVVGYVIFFYLVPTKITGIIKKQPYIDRFIHIILTGIIGVTLCMLCAKLFPEDPQNIMTHFLWTCFSSYIIGFFGVILFGLLAMIIGIIRVNVSHLKPFMQVIICGVVGFLLSTVVGTFFGEKLFNFLGILGGTTGTLVTIIINFINTPSVKQSEGISQQ